MPRRARARSSAPKDRRPSPEGPFHNPFLGRASELKELISRPQPPPARPARPSPVSEADLFRAHVADVKPLKRSRETALPSARPEPLPAVDEDLEALAELEDLVSGFKPLDVRDTDEYVEGARPGLNPEILRRLRDGLYPINGHLDLHGFNLGQARERVGRFLVESRRRGLRGVLIVHGRGLSSPQGQPVLKPHLVSWLSRTGLSKQVLAFATARPYDGGAGALYVLLRR